MTLFNLHSEPVQDAWLDAYGHVNEGYYLVAFSNANWAIQDQFDIGETYFDETGCAFYTLESHIRYVQEIRAPAVVTFESMVIAADAKKIHVGHVLKVDGTERSTLECLMLHYDTHQNRPTAMPETVQLALQEATLDNPPDWAGRSVSIVRK